MCSRIHTWFHATLVDMGVVLLIGIVAGRLCGSDRIIPKPTMVVNPPVNGMLRAPDGSCTADGGYSVEMPPSVFHERGTLAMWIRLGKTLRDQKLPDIPLLSCDALGIRIMPRGDSVYILTDFGPRMTGSDSDGKQKPYAFQSLLTHLKANTWYHVAWSWDSKDWRRNNFYLDGIAQDGPGPYNYPGQIVSAASKIKVRVGSTGVITSAIAFYQEPLTEKSLQAIVRSSGDQGYQDEGVRFTGEKFYPTDVEWSHPIYECTFDDPSSLRDWQLEGGYRMNVEDGSLVLENGSGESASHLVCWLKHEVPSDFLLEFAFQPCDRKKGLAIVFFNARGINGESIFDSSLSPRNGDFTQYHSGDINCYHVSYWAGGRGTANIRKNKGFHLVAVGKDLVTPSSRDGFQTIRVYKRGGKIRLMVDDVVAVSYDDDGKTYGRIWDHPGWIGLRQMSHAGWCKYGYVKVYPLKSED